MTDVSIISHQPRTLAEQVQVIAQALTMMTRTNTRGGSWRWVLVVEPTDAEGNSLAVGVTSHIEDMTAVKALLEAGIARCETPTEVRVLSS